MKNMKNIVLTSAVLVAMASSTAMAADHDASASFILEATAVATCVLGAPSVSGPLTLVVADADTAIAAEGTDMKIRFGDSYCNFPHEIKLVSENQGMSYDGGVAVHEDSDEFVQKVQYKAVVKGWSENLTLRTVEAQTASILPTDAFRNDATDSALRIKLKSEATGVIPMLAGTYSDTLTIMLMPTI